MWAKITVAFDVAFVYPMDCHMALIAEVTAIQELGVVAPDGAVVMTKERVPPLMMTEKGRDHRLAFGTVANYAGVNG